ncbi:DUF7009 family protein [Pareuzebyella sediminis]|uniref:DUF7009 family protein n=1 Tax=Pareuzebyella sediminis TaxID=2607998 RepID=UPI0011EE98D4|nr:hypothetical protein [Pareuzebyella sediminis]
MKIRIKGNAIRIRITKSEVADFCKNGYLEEKTFFNTGVFKYAIRQERNASCFEAIFEDNTISFILPKEMVESWEVNEVVGFENIVVLSDGKELSLLLEKDFTCLEPRKEDQTDNYPNPKFAE